MPTGVPREPTNAVRRPRFAPHGRRHRTPAPTPRRRVGARPRGPGRSCPRRFARTKSPGVPCARAARPSAVLLPARPGEMEGGGDEDIQAPLRVTVSKQAIIKYTEQSLGCPFHNHLLDAAAGFSSVGSTSCFLVGPVARDRSIEANATTPRLPGKDAGPADLVPSSSRLTRLTPDTYHGEQ